MNNNLEIPKELGVKESLLYRSLMNASEGNLEKKWKLSKTQNLVGKKVTNSMSGEIRVSFSKEKRLDVAFRADAESLVLDKKKEEPVVITREDLVRRRANLDMDIDVIRRKKEMVDMMLKEFFGK